MSHPIEFYGYSDDTVIAERGGEWKDAGAFDRIRVCEITAPDGSAIRVFGAYYPNHEGNGWGFGLVQAGEEDGEPVPEWAQNVRFERNGDPDYSVRMYVYAPEGSTFRWMGEDERMMLYRVIANTGWSTISTGLLERGLAEKELEKMRESYPEAYMTSGIDSEMLRDPIDDAFWEFINSLSRRESE